jgi:L-ascorbate metabolism protein UlaG (beta-lactamase superfamily)
MSNQITVPETITSDIVDTDSGPLEIFFIGHGTLMFLYKSKVIHLDPIGAEADYSKLPKADLILITHEHHDHLDPSVLDILRTDHSQMVYTEICASQYPGGIIMKNGEIKTVMDLEINAVPAYNLVHTRSPGTPFHPKGIGNGYIVSFGDTRVYLAGDSENTPEMKQLKNIDIAFLPMNLPYTMTPEMVADAAMAFRPRILYPYHYGSTDTQNLLQLMSGEKDIEVRIRDLK